MSWLSCNKPAEQSDQACSVIEALIIPNAKDLGGFSVRRVLPSTTHKMVGPFIFFDHLGPATFPPGSGIDVRPHPHIGLATITYLFAGTIVHRDNLGNVQKITPGDVNWMTAGKGIVHSERSDPIIRQSAEQVEGLQIWVALPKKFEETVPQFNHYAANKLPVIEGDGYKVKVIAGAIMQHTSPVQTFSRLFYADVNVQVGASFTMPNDYSQRALYILSGELEIAGEKFIAGRMLIFKTACSVTVNPITPVTMVILGGDPLDGPREVWWNFVASSTELIEQAKRDWENGKFAAVPGETEFIPLPD